MPRRLATSVICLVGSSDQSGLNGKLNGGCFTYLYSLSHNTASTRDINKSLCTKKQWFPNGVGRHTCVAGYLMSTIHYSCNCVQEWHLNSLIWLREKNNKGCFLCFIQMLPFCDKIWLKRTTDDVSDGIEVCLKIVAWLLEVPWVQNGWNPLLFLKKRCYKNLLSHLYKNRLCTWKPSRDVFI